MSFKVEIDITPDEDAEYNGVFFRCPACLAAEKAWEERNP